MCGWIKRPLSRSRGRDYEEEDKEMTTITHKPLALHDIQRGAVGHFRVGEGRRGIQRSSSPAPPFAWSGAVPRIPGC